MQDVAGLTLEPADLITPAVARNKTEAGRDISVESQHPHLVTLEHLRVMEERQVMQNGVVGGKANVMGQPRAGQIDLCFMQ